MQIFFFAHLRTSTALSGRCGNVAKLLFHHPRPSQVKSSRSSQPSEPLKSAFELPSLGPKVGRKTSHTKSESAENQGAAAKSRCHRSKGPAHPSNFAFIGQHFLCQRCSNRRGFRVGIKKGFTSIGVSVGVADVHGFIHPRSSLHFTRLSTQVRPSKVNYRVLQKKLTAFPDCDPGKARFFLEVRVIPD